LTSGISREGPAAGRRSLLWVDVARVAAILAVIAIHTVAKLIGQRSLPESWWFANLVFSAARWSVPLFVMLSGALLLRADGEDDPIRFYRRRVARLLPPLVAWTVIYLLYGHFSANNPRTLHDAVAYVLAGRPYFHLYFLYLIAGLYVIAPILRPLVALPGSRALAIAVLVLLALGMVDDVIVVWGHQGGVNAVTRFVPYVGYFMAGPLLIRVPPSRRRIVLAACVAALGIVVTALGTYLLLANVGFRNALYLYEYLSVTTVPVTLAIFALFMWSAPLLDRLAGRVPARALSTMAAATLGIYVIHPLVMRGLSMAGLGARAFFVPLAVTVFVLATFAISLVIVLGLHQVPGIRRLV
jgi:surface polysaccharide O-acyltransferase-like enzyme